MPRSRPDGRVERGQSLSSAFSARQWNRMCDATDLVLGGRYGVGADPASARQESFDWCLAKNNTESLVPRWGVMAIEGVEIEPVDELPASVKSFEESPVLSCDTPAADSETLCIAVEPIRPNAIGRVAVSGIVQCRLEVANESHGFAKTKTSTNELVSGEAGQVKILWKQPGTGQGKLALIRFQSSFEEEEEESQNVFLFGSFTGTWSLGTTKSVSLAGGSSLVALNTLCGLSPAGSCGVLVGSNGTQWYLVQPNLTQLPGFSSSGVIVLSAVNGNLQWYPTSACFEP